MLGKDRTDRNNVLFAKFGIINDYISYKELHKRIEEKGGETHYYSLLRWARQKVTKKEMSEFKIIKLEPVIEEIMKDLNIDGGVF